MAVQNAQHAQQSNATNVGEIWEKALDRFQDDVALKLQGLVKAHSVEEILSEIHGKEASFRHWRHDDSKLDKFRARVSQSLEPVDALCKLGSSAVTSVRYFPRLWNKSLTLDDRLSHLQPLSSQPFVI